MAVGYSYQSDTEMLPLALGWNGADSAPDRDACVWRF